MLFVVKERLEGLKYNIDFGGRGGRNQEEGVSTLLSPILALNSCMFLQFFTWRTLEWNLLTRNYHQTIWQF